VLLRHLSCQTQEQQYDRFQAEFNDLFGYTVCGRKASCAPAHGGCARVPGDVDVQLLDAAAVSNDARQAQDLGADSQAGTLGMTNVDVEPDVRLFE
jgi:hypothetical protein